MYRSLNHNLVLNSEGLVDYLGYSSLFSSARRRGCPSDPVLPVRGDEAKWLLHAGVHRQLHCQRTGHVPEGGAGQTRWWVYNCGSHRLAFPSVYSQQHCSCCWKTWKISIKFGGWLRPWAKKQMIGFWGTNLDIWAHSATIISKVFWCWYRSRFRYILGGGTGSQGFL